MSSATSATASDLSFKLSSLRRKGSSVRDSGLIIEVDLPVFDGGDELYTKHSAALVFNGSVPYALFERNGQLMMAEIEREVMRCGVKVIGGKHLHSLKEALYTCDN